MGRETHQPTQRLLATHTGPIAGIALSRDGRRIASVSYVYNFAAPHQGPGGQLRITEVDTGRPVVEVTENGYGALSVAFSPDGKQVAVGADDKTIRLRDAETGAAIGPPLTGPSENASALAYSVDGTQIISSGGYDLHVWAADPDRSVGKALGIFALFGPTAVSPDGLTMATRDRTTSRNRAVAPRPGRTCPHHHDRPLRAGHRSRVACGRAGHRHQRRGDNAVRIWTAQTGAPVGEPLTGSTVASRLCRSAGRPPHRGRQLDASVWLWDLGQSPARRQRLDGNAGSVTIVGFSADGHRLMAASLSHFASGDPTHCRGENPFNSSEVMTASSVRVWNVDTGELAGPPVSGRGGRAAEAFGPNDDPPIFAAAISPDGQRILVSTSAEVQFA